MIVHSVLWTSRAPETKPSRVLGAVPGPLDATGLALNLAENTGGRHTSIATATGYVRALTDLAADLVAHHEEASHRYRLLYERPDSRGQHVSVDVLRPGLEVRLLRDRRMDDSR